MIKKEDLKELDKNELLEIYFKLEINRLETLKKDKFIEEMNSYFNTDVSNESKETIMDMYLDDDEIYKLDYSRDELIDSIIKLQEI